jgi:hypothetical protein
LFTKERNVTGLNLVNVVATSQVRRVRCNDQETIHEVSLLVHNVRDNRHIGTTLSDKFETVNLPGGEAESLTKLLTCVLLTVLQANTAK